MIMTALAVGSFAMGIAQGAMTASANRQMAEANMAALKLEKAWNMRVMGQNKRDVYARNILESWGAGIDPTSGSQAAVIKNNQRVLQEEMNFREQQYDIQIQNLKAQSKQKFLGLF